MDTYTWLASRVLFPLHERLKGHDTVRIYREMQRTQWLPPAEIEKLRLERLRSLLRHAGDTVPFYRTLFAEAGCAPEAVTSLSDLGRLPILTKDIVRQNLDRMRSTAGIALEPWTTSGSTGTPFKFYVSKQRISHDIAAKWRTTTWFGVDIGDREIVAWNSPLELAGHDWVKTVRDRVFRSKLLPATSLSPRRMDEFLEEIRRFRPRQLFGYPTSLALLAERAVDRGLRLDRIGIKVAFVTAERLLPHHREMITKGFGCRVANQYGARDSGYLAHECPEGNMHITAEDLIVEIVDEAGRPVPAGTPGELAVTNLFSHGFPFIRYKNGDVAVLSDRTCPCGRGLPLLEDVHGRTNDVLIAADGGRVHSVVFSSLMRDVPGARQFKIVQETRDHVTLQLVVGGDFDEAVSYPLLRRVFADRLGVGVNLSIERVNAIAPEPSGKYKYIVCRIPGV